MTGPPNPTRVAWDVRQLIDKINGRITYKNWAIKLKLAAPPPGAPYWHPGVELSWEHPSVDIHTGKPNIASGRRILAVPFPEDFRDNVDLAAKYLVVEMWAAIIGAETHEAMEHFQLGGVCVYDPHPDGKSATEARVFEPNLDGLHGKTPTP